jgi:hypothetical protein
MVTLFGGRRSSQNRVEWERASEWESGHPALQRGLLQSEWVMPGTREYMFPGAVVWQGRACLPSLSHHHATKGTASLPVRGTVPRDGAYLIRFRTMFSRTASQAEGTAQDQRQRQESEK